MNDNTSGVAALLTLLARLPKEQRGRVAVVLFDNEEVGLIGSTLFRRRHAHVMANKPLINLDCVGDGEMLLLAPNKGYRADEALWARTQRPFPPGASRPCLPGAPFIPPTSGAFPRRWPWRR